MRLPSMWTQLSWLSCSILCSRVWRKACFLRTINILMCLQENSQTSPNLHKHKYKAGLAAGSCHHPAPGMCFFLLILCEQHFHLPGQCEEEEEVCPRHQTPCTPAGMELIYLISNILHIFSSMFKDFPTRFMCKYIYISIKII